MLPQNMFYGGFSMFFTFLAGGIKRWCPAVVHGELLPELSRYPLHLVIWEAVQAADFSLYERRKKTTKNHRFLKYVFGVFSKYLAPSGAKYREKG